MTVGSGDRDCQTEYMKEQRRAVHMEKSEGSSPRRSEQTAEAKVQSKAVKRKSKRWNRMAKRADFPNLLNLPNSRAHRKPNRAEQLRLRIMR